MQKKTQKKKMQKFGNNSHTVIHWYAETLNIKFESKGIFFHHIKIL